MKKITLSFLAISLNLLSINAQTLGSSIADSIMANSNNLPYIHADTVFLPDGAGVSYSSVITHTDFGVGQTLQNGNEISSVCMNIEHSYINDLSIELECPNGSKVTLDSYSGTGAGSTFLGDALDIIPGQGVGMNYCFSESAIWGTMDEENQSQNWLPSTISPGNNILTSGLFNLDGYLDSLIGCPLNGDWTMIITDHIASDDGYNFNWQINFDTTLFPANYNLGSARVEAVGGVPPYTYFWSNGCTSETASRLAPGVYEVIVTDSDTSTGGNFNKAAVTGNRTTSTVVITEGGLTSIEVNLNDNYSIYPNPAQDQITINIDRIERFKKLEVFNAIGVKVLEENSFNDATTQLDIRNFEKGVYFLKIETNNQTILNKFIKK